MEDSRVRVAVRVRPFTLREKKMNDTCIIQMDGKQTTITNPENGISKTFSFDYSIWSHNGFAKNKDGYFEADPNHTGIEYKDQEFVYNELGSTILDNAWKGFHSCIFAYGQTGSGKSYSMIGYNNNIGIVPRFTEEIFERISRNTEKSKRFEGKIKENILI